MIAKKVRQSRSVSELVERLAAHFPEGTPTEQTVRDQGFSFYKHHWTDRWPSTLADPPVLGGSGDTRVTRQSLLGSADLVRTDDDAVDFYVRVCSWGAGTKAQRIARCVKPLHQPGAVRSLMEARRVVRSGDVLGAYAAMWRGGERRIKYLGPAFFTNWLYFSAYEDWDSMTPAPLILDARVANALGWWPYGWSAQDYETYLERAEKVRQQWCPDSSTHVIEYALFKLGAKD